MKGKTKRKRISLPYALVLCVLLVMIPVNAWFIYSAARAQEIILNNTRGTIENVGEFYANDLKRRTTSIANYFYDLCRVDGEIFELSKIRDETEFVVRINGASNLLREHMVVYADADVFNLYSASFKRGITRLKSGTDNISLFRTQLEARYEQGIGQGWFVEEINGERWLFQGGRYHGICYSAGVNLNRIEASAKHDILYDHVTVKIEQDAISQGQSTDIITSVYVSPIQGYLNISVSRSEVLQNLPVLQRFNVLFALFGLLAIPILLLSLYFFVLKEMRILTAAMERLKSDSEYRIEEQAVTREFGNVFQAFNSMAGKILELKIENYERTLAEQRLELQTMELQMNPHFLMNTFNLIYNLAQLKEFKHIQELVLYLTSYFRYLNTKLKDGTTVNEELELIQQYLKVASLQHPDKFDWQLDVDPALEEFRIPSLLLHNFVENFIKYGVSFDKRSTIQVLGQTLDGDIVEFVVLDDGRGMPAEVAEGFNEGNFDLGDGRHHLGIRNNYLRLQMLYHGKGSLHIESAPNRGVRVTIRLPLHEEL